MASSAESEFLQRLVAAADRAQVGAACRRLRAERRLAGQRPASSEAELAGAAYAYLRGISAHPAFLRWLDSYFGRRRETFRSARQKPAFIYYPGLDPMPWFESSQVPGLAGLRERVPSLRVELLEAVAAEKSFCPYVQVEAARDPMWRGLAGSSDWLATHLLRGGQWNTALMQRLPLTRAFLEQAPLAQCPPHAPECFISRLRPGVLLPPHYGLSNIKLTVHMAIELPPQGCSITVGGITRTWPLDDFLIFDDSFLHTAANRSQQDRTVLILDVWHPGLSPGERDAMAHAIAVLDEVRTAWGGVDEAAVAAG
ncbi:MAG: aspartyl/asparaginyl beta-hydroxylase domain-containing protein [Pseudomonadota bacterium]|nr:aspartyl/asparaginyl beta-hydroxylase domain-containing protein [Pseudomonadota bacterium]